MFDLSEGSSAAPVPDVLWFSCDGMMVIDENRRILAMNPALERLLETADQRLYTAKHLGGNCVISPTGVP